MENLTFSNVKLKDIMVSQTDENKRLKNVIAISIIIFFIFN